MDASNATSNVEKMLTLNQEQATFYDNLSQSGNVATRLWRGARRRVGVMRRMMNLEQSLSDLHRSWLGDLAGKSLLDLGAYAGNPLSLRLAQESERYLAIDLSAEGITRLQASLQASGAPNASAQVIDFLAPDFTDTFDAIYARSVMHHFAYFEDFLVVLKRHLNPGGVVVSYDPMQTDPASRLLRAAYRPFQSDKQWEWPFTRETFSILQRHFRITNIQGQSASLRWAYPVAIISPSLGAALGKGLHAKDLRNSSSLGPRLFNCTQVSMRLEPIG